MLHTKLVQLTQFTALVGFRSSFQKELKMVLKLLAAIKLPDLCSGKDVFIRIWLCFIRNLPDKNVKYDYTKFEGGRNCCTHSLLPRTNRLPWRIGKQIPDHHYRRWYGRKWLGRFGKPYWTILVVKFSGWVGDFFVTNFAAAKRYRRRCTNSILIKVNQIGTLAETFDAIIEMKRAGLHCCCITPFGETWRLSNCWHHLVTQQTQV